MSASRYLTIAVVSALLILAGCSSSHLSQGNRAMNKNDFETARQHFEQALERNPDNVKALTGLGMAFYKLTELDQAEANLSRALELNPKNGAAALYLGLVNEQKGEIGKASRIYSSYLLYDEKSSLARSIKGRLLYTRNEQLRQQVKDALAFEQSEAVDTVVGDAVGVLPFVLPEGSADSLQPLATGLAAAVMYDLSQVEQLHVIERLELKYLLDELSLQQQGLLDSSASLRLGAIVRARHLVNGSLAAPSSEDVRLQSGLVNIEGSDSYYSNAYDGAGGLKDLLKMQKQMTIAIVDSLGIELSEKEMEALGKPITDSLSAFLAYSRGLVALDAGNFGLAESYFGQATTIDPGFVQAQELHEEAATLEQSSGAPQEFEPAIGLGKADASGGFDATSLESLQDVHDLIDAITDPRNDLLPPIGSTTATVGGVIVPGGDK